MEGWWRPRTARGTGEAIIVLSILGLVTSFYGFFLAGTAVGIASGFLTIKAKPRRETPPPDWRHDKPPPLPDWANPKYGRTSPLSVHRSPRPAGYHPRFGLAGGMEPTSVHRELLLPAPVHEPPEIPPLTWTSSTPFWLEVHGTGQQGSLHPRIRIREGPRVDDDLPREYALPTRCGVRTTVSRGGHHQTRSVRAGGRRPATSPPPARASARGRYRRLPTSHPGLPHAPGSRCGPTAPIPADPNLGRRTALPAFQPVRGTTGSRPPGRDGVSSRRTCLSRRAARTSPRAPTAGGADRSRFLAGAVDDQGWRALALLASNPPQSGTALSRRVRYPRHRPVLEQEGATRRLRDRTGAPAEHSVGCPPSCLLVCRGTGRAARAGLRATHCTDIPGARARTAGDAARWSEDRRFERTSVTSAPGHTAGCRTQWTGSGCPASGLAPPGHSRADPVGEVYARAQPRSPDPGQAP